MKPRACTPIADAIRPVFEALATEIAASPARSYQTSRYPGHFRGSQDPGWFLDQSGWRERLPKWHDPASGVHFLHAYQGAEEAVRRRLASIEGDGVVFYGYASVPVRFPVIISGNHEVKADAVAQVALGIVAGTKDAAVERALAVVASVAGDYRAAALDSKRQDAIRALTNALTAAHRAGLSDQDVQDAWNLARVREVMGA